MDAARRPSGPVVALLIVPAASAIGQVVIGVPVYLLLFGLASPDEGGLARQLYSTVVVFAATTVALYLWVRFKGGATVRDGRLPVGSTEEILTRGYLMQATVRRWGLVAGVAVQAALFALLHGLNPGTGPLAVANLVLVAVFLAGWALLEGGLWGVCAWHAVWNWAQGNVWGLLVSGQPITTSLLVTRPAPAASDLVTGGGFGPEGGLFVTLVLLAGIAVVAWVWRRAV